MATSKRQTTPEKTKLGGYRPNAGRKAEDGVVNARNRSVNLTDAQNEFFKSLGGSLWLRKELNRRAAKQGVDLS